MKRLLNKAWIGIAAALAVVAAACCSHKPSPSNNDPANQESDEHQMTKRELKDRIAEIQARIKEREMSCVYGSPEIIEQYGRETRRLRHEMDSLQNVLDNWGKK
ncbi:MAG: hypothetical protein K6A28_06310 [Bacteroidales bacterium]|nr:hypothetical protein [Bacteroidales bacterium]